MVAVVCFVSISARQQERCRSLISETLLRKTKMIPLSALPLNALRAVEAVGRLRSLAAAADELRVTAGAVSQHLKKAEELLGVTLFDRLSAGLAPTAAGGELLPRLGAGFREIVDAVAALTRNDDRILTITTGSAFAVGWLVPRLSRFTQAHQDLQIRFVATAELIDLARSDIDVGIRLGKGDWPGLISERLIDQFAFPVSSPVWRDKVRRPEDLGAVPVIRDEGTMMSWDDWFREVGLDAPLALTGPSFTDPVLAFGAALAGQGVMLAWSLIASDALADGRLIRPFGAAVRTDIAYWFVTTQERRRKPKVRAFRAWIEAEIAASLANGIGAAG
jgi:DNA-binding transcriptional LysR family regulator